MSKTVLMEEMTWPEIEQAVQNGCTTAIVVSGSIEQHGPHLPTATDTILGYAMAKRAAEQLKTALVAPVIRPALSEHHIGFAGSFTLSFETYQAVLEDYCASLIATGFEHIVLISSHGGNTATLTAVTPFIAKSFMGEAAVYVIDNLGLSHERTAAMLEAGGISRAKAGVHSGYAETSMMLAVAPDLVKMDRADGGLTDEAFYDPANLPRSQIDCFTLGIKHFSPNGVLGDPEGADAEVGQRLLDVAVETLVEAINNVVG